MPQVALHGPQGPQSEKAQPVVHAPVLHGAKSVKLPSLTPHTPCTTVRTRDVIPPVRCVHSHKEKSHKE